MQGRFEKIRLVTLAHGEITEENERRDHSRKRPVSTVTFSPNSQERVITIRFMLKHVAEDFASLVTRGELFFE